MANSVSPQNPSPSPATEPVVLVPSARFITRSETLPAGVRPRDVTAYLEGLVEENSPLPVEYVSWGFLPEGKASQKERSVLLYAAAKELIFGSGRRSVPQRPTLPAFAALYGFKVREPGWVFLADAQSLAAVLLRPGQALPARIHARFTGKNDEESLWETRTRLIAEIKPSKGEKLLPGLVRVENIRASAGRIDFQLTRLPSAGAKWENWQQTRLAPQVNIGNADLRERALLLAQQEKERSGRSMKMVGTLVVAGILLIVGLEFLLNKRATEAEDLAALAQRQKATVLELQQMETMTKALEQTLQRKSRPFELLNALNDKRPENLYVKAMSYGEESQLRVSGEADNIQIVNNYTAALREEGYWEVVDLAEVRTEANGQASFQLRLKANKNAAKTAKPTEATAEPEAAAATTENPPA